MRFVSVEFKNIFAYGEQVQRVDYSDTGKLILLKGQSGAGKSAILSLPILVLYGKLTKVTKASIANRVNKHGWIRGTIIKGQHTYVIEREFSPNTLRIWKDDVEVDIYGSSAGEDYIANEIIEIPITTFTNMISISMKKFKSFLSMSPTERKQVVDEVFDVRVINVVFEQLKKDAKEIGTAINGENATLFSLGQTLTNANNELVKIQEKNATPDALEQIEANNKKITELNQQLNQYNTLLLQVNEKLVENSNALTAKRGEIIQNDGVIQNILQKQNLFNQSKCPTCGSTFEGEHFDQVRQVLENGLKEKYALKESLTAELNDLMSKSQKIAEGQKKVNDGIYQIRVNINSLTADNRVIDEKMKASAEYQAVQNIIDKTTEQIDAVKKNIDEYTKRLLYFQKLQIVFSIKGVTKMVIDNYLPKLNEEIAENLLMLNFPYSVSFDSEFNASLKDMGHSVDSNSLSDGEATRVDLVILLSLYKLLKRRYSTLNLLTIDEVVSSLDTTNSAIAMEFIKTFAEENNLNVFVVSHTDLDLDTFDEVIEVEKVNGFSHLTRQTMVA